VVVGDMSKVHLLQTTSRVVNLLRLDATEDAHRLHDEANTVWWGFHRLDFTNVRWLECVEGLEGRVEDGNRFGEVCIALVFDRFCSHGLLVGHRLYHDELCGRRCGR
jgi:hypothetical protein